MKKLKQLKLNQLSQVELEKREMKMLHGGCFECNDYTHPYPNRPDYEVVGCGDFIDYSTMPLPDILYIDINGKSWWYRDVTVG